MLVAAEFFWGCKEGMVLGKGPEGHFWGACRFYLPGCRMLGCSLCKKSSSCMRLIYSLFHTLVIHQKNLMKKNAACQIKFRTVLPAPLLCLEPSGPGAGGALPALAIPQSLYQGEKIFFPFLFFPLPWPGAIVHMQMWGCQLWRRAQLFIAGVLQHLSQLLQT